MDGRQRPGGSGAVRLRPALVILVVAQGFFELVFEDDDPAGGFQGGALLDHLSSPHRQA